MRSSSALIWRVTKPLLAAAPAHVRAGASMGSASASRRFFGFTVTRCAPATANAATATAEKITPASASTPGAEEADGAPIELKDIGAETSKVLTISDVLSRREQEVAEQGSSATLFEEWESIPATHTVQDAIDLMVESSMGSLIVTESNEGIVGIVTERDILKKTSPRAIATDQVKPVKEIMSAQIMCIPPTTTVIEALATMTKENIRHLAVINGELSNAVKKGSVPEEAMRCVLSIKDIVKAYSQFETQKKVMQEQVQQQLAEMVTSVVEPVDAATPAHETTGTTTAAATPDGKVDDAAGAAAAAAAATATTAGLAPPVVNTVPVVTAATLLKKKHKKIKLILNTRVEDNVTVAEAVEEMAKHNFGCVLVVDKEQRVLGIFTERDYLTKVLYCKLDPQQTKVTDVCTKKKLACLQIEDTLEKCWNQFAAQDFRHFPVIGTMRKDREKELAGVLSIKDIVREISKGYETKSGFRLMEFFKSKMSKDDTVTPPPPPQSPPSPAPDQAASPTATAEATEAQPKGEAATAATTTTDGATSSEPPQKK